MRQKILRIQLSRSCHSHDGFAHSEESVGREAGTRRISSMFDGTRSQ